LTFLRDGDSINFQKASCTLDGCVKIYSSRVDSVADETGKLLNGLVTDSATIDKELVLKDDDEEEAEKKKHKRPNRAIKTLEKNMENLTLKSFEQDCSADPLFRKTCAFFDEQGSRAGMLLGMLPIAPEDLHIVFDSNAPEATAIDGSNFGDEDGFVMERNQ
jgi:condensin complex subunit 2